MEITNKFELHYYLENESHSIDAFVRNKCEKELLEIFQEVSKILGVNLSIESFPSQEGGYRDIWDFIGKDHPQLRNIGAVCTFLLALYTATARPNELDTQLKQEQIGLTQDQREKTKAEIENIKADTELKRLKIPSNSLIGVNGAKSQNNNEDKMNVLRKKMQQNHVSNETLHEFVKILEQHRKIQISRSHIYNYLLSAKKVTGVGFSVLSATGEVIEEEKFVPRSDFKKYIRNNKPDKDTNHDAFIEIVAPVLKEGNYKWKGLYLDQIISFSMKDKNFKADVLSKKISFQHGSGINCVLDIVSKLDEMGELVSTEYSVKTVLATSGGDSVMEMSQAKAYRTPKKSNYSQGKLFEV